MLRQSITSSRLVVAILFAGLAIASIPSAADANSSRTACTPNLTGSWTGYWTSHSNGHTGPMRARFEQIDACHYRVVFWGRFWKVMPFRYATTLNVVGTGNGCVYLRGSHQLGPIFGTFSYNASASQCRFVSNYRAANDHGQFVLTRRE